MKKLLFAAVFFSLFTLGAGDTFACSCSLPTKEQSVSQQIKASYKSADAVFYGEVTKITQPPGAFYVIVKFKVEKSWKNLSREQVIIQTGQSGGDCGYGFEIGKKYLVYAYNSNNLQTSICTRTSASGEDSKYLDKIIKPKLFPKESERENQ